MKKSNNPGPSLNSQETVCGLIWFCFQLVFLPSILHTVNGLLDGIMGTAELNFAYYLVNFLSILLLFQNFLSRSAAQVGKHPAYFCQAVILGLAAYHACFYAVDHLVSLLVPGFSNHNDASIAAMLQKNPFLMFIGTVILVPPFEECIFRGLIFRSLWSKSHALAYAVSILSFSMIHILGYWGQYSPLELVIAVLQYLPAGLCLAWCYIKAETIFAPIAVHAAINYITIQSFR